MFHEFTMDLLSFTRIHYRSGEFTMKTLGVSRSYHEIYNLFRIFIMNIISILRINKFRNNYETILKQISNSL